VPLPPGLLPHVQAVQVLLPSTPGLRLLKPEQLHVTLAFIGEVSAEKGRAAQSVVEELAESLGGTALLEDFLLLPSSAHPRVVTLSITDTSGVFARLYEMVITGLEQAGVMRREKRPFRPHLTIARVKSGRVQPKADAATVVYAIESVRLYRSRLARTGAEYTVITERRLGAP